MARASAFVAGMALGLVLGTAIVVSHADPAEAEVQAAAAEAHVDPTDLLGAMYSTGQADPYAYLRSVGELPPLKPAAPLVLAAPSSSGRVACIIGHESGGDPGATNGRTKAAGLGQFLWSTWATTPQGKAGLSPYNPTANRAAIQYMLDAGRAREFDAVRFYGC